MGKLFWFFKRLKTFPNFSYRKFPEKAAKKNQSATAGNPKSQSTPVIGGKKGEKQKPQQKSAESSDDDLDVNLIDECLWIFLEKCVFNLQDEDLSDDDLSGGDFIEDEAEEGEEPIDDDDDDDDDDEEESDEWKFSPKKQIFVFSFSSFFLEFDGKSFWCFSLIYFAH